MKSHSEKQTPASKPSTKSLLRASLDRAGKPDFADAPIRSDNTYAPSDKFQEQSVSLRRRGSNVYADYLDTVAENDHESTGNDGRGSRKGSR